MDAENLEFKSLILADLNVDVRSAVVKLMNSGIQQQNDLMRDEVLPYRTIDGFVSYLQNKNAYVHLLRYGDRIIGCAVTTEMNERAWYLSGVNIDKSFQSRRFGKYLCKMIARFHKTKNHELVFDIHAKNACSLKLAKNCKTVAFDGTKNVFNFCL